MYQKFEQTKQLLKKKEMVIAVNRNTYNGILYRQVYKDLEKRAEAILWAIDKKKKELASLPQERLWVSKHNKTFQFFISNDKNKKIYLNKKDAKRIKALAQREYDLKYIDLAGKEYAAIKKLLKTVSHGGKQDPDSFLKNIFSSTHKAKQDYIIPVVYDNEAAIKKWMEKPFSSNPMPFTIDPIFTLKNERVRSKSERFFANTLFRMGLPYKYEARLVLGDTVIYPDFTILDVMTMQEVYVEHFGKMDDPEYAEKMIRKIQLYEANGIYLGERLLVTFESSNIVMNQENLEKVLRERFIERYR